MTGQRFCTAFSVLLLFHAALSLPTGRRVEFSFTDAKLGRTERHLRRCKDKTFGETAVSDRRWQRLPCRANQNIRVWSRTLPILLWVADPSDRQRDTGSDVNGGEVNWKEQLVRCRARVAYDGTGFDGFQLQDPYSRQLDPLDDVKSKSPQSRRTVQGVLERALNQRFRGCCASAVGDNNRTRSGENQEGSRMDYVDGDFGLIRADSRVRDRTARGQPSLGPFYVRVTGAGRTDAGVHARGQAIHFDLPRVCFCERERTLSRIERQPADYANGSEPGVEAGGVPRYGSPLSAIETDLNRMLPSDLRIYHLQVAPAPTVETVQVVGTQRGDLREVRNKSVSSDVALGPSAIVLRPYVWNVMHHSLSKRYSYRLSLAPVMHDPLERFYRWHPDQADVILANLQVLASVLLLFEGTHDFRAFAGAIPRMEKYVGRRVDTVRTVYRARLVHENSVAGNQAGRQNYRIDFDIQGALYKQIRNMVGTAIDTCRGRLTVADVHRLLNLDEDDQDVANTRAARDLNPCKPAPPQGLTLEKVFFDIDQDPEF
jgi:tRNA pseudouridine38-40 synthase